MKKQTTIALALIFALCLGSLSLGSVFADSGAEEPEAPNATGQGEVPVPIHPNTETGVTWGRDIIFYKEKESRLTAQKIAYEDKNGEDICEDCVANGQNYKYENGVITLNNFGTQNEKLVLEVTGTGSLEIKLQGDNYYNLQAVEGDMEIKISGTGTMNGDIESEDGPGYGVSSSIIIDGPKINSESIFDMFGSVIINSGEVNVINETGQTRILYAVGSGPVYGKGNGPVISTQNLEINGGKLNIESQGTGIEIINRTGYSPSENPGIIVNGGEISILAKEYAVLEQLMDTIDYTPDGDETLIKAKDGSEKTYDTIIKLGKDVGIKETGIAIQRYKVMNSAVILGIEDPYSYYTSLAYENYNTTKGGNSIRNSVKVLHIGKNFSNNILKNDNIVTFDTLKNVKSQFSYGYSSEEEKLELEEIEIDRKVIAPSRYNVSREEDYYTQSATGISYSLLNIEIPPKTLFELGAGKHAISFRFKGSGVRTYDIETNEWGYKKEEENEIEIAESFKDYEYLLTHIDNPILEGEDETVIIDDDASYRIRFDRNIQLFDGFTIDGKEVPEKYYEIKSGSTIIEIKPEFLNSLSLGKHTIAAKFLAEDDPISTNLTIVKAEDDRKEEKDEEKKEEKKKGTADSPDTGVFSKDNSAAMASIVAAVICALSVTILAIIRSKKSNKKINYHL